MKKQVFKYIFSFLLLIGCLVSYESSFGQTTAFANLSGGLAGSTVTASQSALYGFSVAVSSGSVTFKQYNLTCGSTSQTYLGNGTLYRSTTNTFNSGSPGTPVGNVIFNGGNITINNFSETITNTTYYYFLVADIIANTSYIQIYANTANFATDSNGGTSYPFYGSYLGYTFNVSPTFPLTLINQTSGLASTATTITSGTSGLQLFSFSITNNTGSSYTLSGFKINSTLSTLSNYFSGVSLFTANVGVSTFPGGSPTYTGSMSTSFASFSISEVIGTGQTKYYWLVGNCVVGGSATLPGNLQFSFADKQGSTVTSSSPSATYTTFTAMGNAYNINSANITVAATAGTGLSSTTDYPSQTNVAVFGFGVTATSGSSTLSQININSDNSSLSTYYGNARLYKSSSSTFNSASPGSVVATGTITPGTSFINFTGLSESITSTTTYYYLVVDVVYTGTGTNTTTFKFVSGQSTNALVQSTPTSSYNTFSVTGSTYAITQPSIAVSTLTGGLTSSNLVYGTSNLAVFGFSIQVTGVATVSTINLQASNSNLSTYFTAQLYRNNSSNSYGTGGATAIGTVTFSGGNISITGLSETITNTTNNYFLVVSDIYYTSAAPQVQFNIAYGQTNSAIITSNGSTFNTYSIYSGTYTLTIPTPTVTITGNNSVANGITNGTLVYGQTGIVLFSFKVSVLGVMNITEFDIPSYIGGTSASASGELGNGKIYRSTTPYFYNATQVTGTVAFNTPTTITGMSESYTTYTSPTVYYYFLVADFNGTQLASPTTLKYNFTSGSQEVVSSSPTYQTFNSATTTDGILFNLGVTYYWVGSSSVNFSDNNNWRTQNGSTASTGAPGINDIVQIGTQAYQNPYYQPGILANTTVGGITFGTNNTPTLTFSPGVKLTLSKSLTINSGSTPIISVPSGTASIDMGPLSTVSFGSTSSGSLTIPSSITFTLKSDATGTATVGQLGSSSIAGTGIAAIVAERYIPGGSTARGYRLLSSPVSNRTSASPYTAGLKGYDLSNLQTNTIITGPVGTGNGFTASTTNNPSVFFYKESDPDPLSSNINTSDYKGFASITEYVPIGNGILFFFRGNQNVTKTGNSGNAFTSPYPSPENTTLTFKGAINVGPIAVNVPVFKSGTVSYYNVQGTATGLPAATGVTVASSSTGLSYTNNSSTSDGFNLIGNPYPSTIDLESVTFGAGMSNTVYILNSSQAFGTYQRTGTGTTSSIYTGGGSRYVLSGEGFFVQTLSSGTTANRTITFPEAAKTTVPTVTAGTVTGSPVVFALNKNSTSIIKIKLIQDSVLNNETIVTFNANNKNTYDAADNDAPYLSAPSQQVFMYSTSSDGVYCVINRMSSLDKVKTVNLGAVGSVTGVYQMQFTGGNTIDPAYKLYLMDNLLKDSLDLSANSVYTFQIDRSNAQTYGASRFTLVVHPSGIANYYKLIAFNGVKNYNTVSLNWTTQYEGDYTGFAVERSIDGGKTFTVIDSLQSNGTGLYSYTDANPVMNAVNQYKLAQNNINGVVVFSDVISISYLTVNSETGKLQVFPNPVVSTIQVDINTGGVNNGSIYLKIYNMQGELVINSTFAQGSALSQDVSKLMKGNYVIHITDNAKDYGSATFTKL